MKTTFLDFEQPIAELEAKIARAMNLDTSERYFRTDGELFVMRLPEACTASNNCGQSA